MLKERKVWMVLREMEQNDEYVALDDLIPEVLERNGLFPWLNFKDWKSVKYTIGSLVKGEHAKYTSFVRENNVHEALMSEPSDDYFFILRFGNRLLDEIGFYKVLGGIIVLIITIFSFVPNGFAYYVFDRFFPPLSEGNIEATISVPRE